MPEGDRAVKCDLHCESDAECIDQPATININLGLRKKKFDQVNTGSRVTDGLNRFVRRTRRPEPARR
jgi:hypothetical protein